MIKGDLRSATFILALLILFVLLLAAIYNNPQDSKLLLVSTIQPTVTRIVSVYPSPEPIETLYPEPAGNLVTPILPEPMISPSSTSSAKPTPSPTPDVIVVDQNGDLPHLPLDLRFRIGHQVYRWDHLTNQIELEFDLVSWQEEGAYPMLEWRGDLLFRSNGKWYQEYALGPSEAQVWEVIDLRTNTVRPLIRFEGDLEHPYIVSENISPNGQWMAYCKADIDAKFATISSSLYLVSVEQPTQTMQFGSCNHYVFWSPDQTNFLWYAEDAVWVAGLHSPARKLFSTRTYHLDIYNLRWSPSGRYLLIDHLGAIEGGNIAVLDILTSGIVDIPDTWRYANPAAWANWIQNDRLLTLRPAGWTDATGPLMEFIWQIRPDLPEILKLEKSFPVPGISSGFWPFSGMETSTGEIYFSVLPDNQFYNPANETWQGGVYSYNPSNQELVRLNILPEFMRFPSSDRIFWAPNTSAAVMDYWTQEGKKRYYLPLTGGRVYDISNIVGDGDCCSWMP